ncbi:MAG: hypothetical protein Q4Q04_02560 [Methanocorpusculum sp.]|nr:hypothetical protein [Methanocorpusculum sp.]
MNKITGFLVVLLLLCTAGAAGCLSLGSQTTDIVAGNETVGKIVMTPLSQNLFSNGSLSDKFNMEVELFGMKFSKDGVTKTEANSIMQSLSSGVPSLDVLSGLGLNFSTAPSAGNVTEFLNSIQHMPISNKDNRTVLEALNLNGVLSNMGMSADQIAKIMSGMFGK